MFETQHSRPGVPDLTLVAQRSRPNVRSPVDCSVCLPFLTGKLCSARCIAAYIATLVFLSKRCRNRKWQRGRFCCARCLLKLTTRIASNFARSSARARPESGEKFFEPQSEFAFALCVGNFCSTFVQLFVHFLLSFPFLPTLCFANSVFARFFSLVWVLLRSVPICQSGRL